ncbi:MULTISPECIES: hypothetical protein [unclassified Tardiphaga]|jgi:hypothetical protein|uniref:hypothetical protein n=1 Tax=unclassified Tardiphaga TaxID=2631404 RepID=UPI001E3AC32A|nr:MULTISPECIES: hypothetical protein [unclassified Tardiphaga]UFS76919.1 hypothetical protein LPB73_05915 [Tardiphaga sp. 37S4]WNV11069.1 hypothetical protein RSO67_07815 [Tardiphaga sp. 709]
MTNDNPTSLRMGFGYHQARKSGLGGIRADRSPNQVNRDTRENKAARQLREEAEADPDWGPFIEHWILDGISAEVTLNALWRSQAYMSFKSRGYSRKTTSRYWW